MTSWYKCPDGDTAAAERLLGAWPDAPIENLETCGYILATARDQVWAFAPERLGEDGTELPIPDTDVPRPHALVYAQLKQAENLWNAGRVSSAGDAGMDTFVYQPRPLDKTIRGVIRPIEGAFSVG
jgi:hypothetical protein